MRAKKTKRKFLLIDKIILGLNVLAVISLLLSYFAPSTDPRDFWIIAILGLAYQVILPVNILFVIYWIIRLSPFALLSLISILIGYNAIIANFGFHKMTQKDKKESAENIRVMIYNVRRFQGVDIHEGEPDQNDILQLINDKQPDIVGLVEYTKRVVDRGSVNDSLKKILNTKYSYLSLNGGRNKDSSGLALYSKFPIVNAGTIPENGFSQVEDAYIDLKKDGKIFRVYCVHLQGVHFKKERTKTSHGKVHINQSFLVLDKLNVAFIKRSYQTNKVKKHIADCKYPYVLLGDFDDTPLSYTVGQLGDGLKNAFVEKGSGFETTYYSNFPRLQIDYILCSKDFDVLNYQAIDKKLSDHKPVISDLRLK